MSAAGSHSSGAAAEIQAGPSGLGVVQAVDHTEHVWFRLTDVGSEDTADLSDAATGSLTCRSSQAASQRGEATPHSSSARAGLGAWDRWGQAACVDSVTVLAGIGDALSPVRVPVARPVLVALCDTVVFDFTARGARSTETLALAFWACIVQADCKFRACIFSDTADGAEHALVRIWVVTERLNAGVVTSRDVALEYFAELLCATEAAACSGHQSTRGILANLLQLEKEIRALCLHRIEGAAYRARTTGDQKIVIFVCTVSIEETEFTLIKCRTESSLTDECGWFKREWLDTFVDVTTVAIGGEDTLSDSVLVGVRERVGVQVTLDTRLLTFPCANNITGNGWLTESVAILIDITTKALNEAVVITDTVDLLGTCLECFTTRRA